ncbi:polysaccharide pyruvyl transferase CsaB [Gracilibacillus ureilyticus]|uniref:Polysaccharide pyruvyl transferase CsaB n=2 Tax=Gracilibacillus ureilyticus TaxID=531814 RepID=A0A1H9UNH2_9BACI|nr:polysaccharide pyruvyl transferase CsaB [Gracilibacillus ureilyticus]
MHVVLSGYYGFNNEGDEAILTAIIQSLREIKPDMEITVLSNDPASTAGKHQVQAVNRWKLKEVSNVLKISDGLISGGGSLLQDKTGMKSVPYYSGIMRIAKWHKKPVFIYSQGIGPVDHPLSKWIVKSTLNKVDQITVRDRDSQQLLTSLGLKQETVIVPDPVFGLDARTFSSKWVEDSDITGSFVTVSVRDWPSDQPFKERIAGCLDGLVRDGYSVVFVPFHGDEDYRSSNELVGLMDEDAYVMSADIPMEEKIAVIRESSLLIGMRLHSLIFASIVYTPFVAVSYDPKVDSFAKLMDQPVGGHVNHGDWDSGSLLEVVKGQLAVLDEVQELVKEKAVVQQAKARETAEMAIRVFE